MANVNSYYLYQKFEKRGDQPWIQVFPSTYSVDGDGTMPLVVKQLNDLECRIPSNSGITYIASSKLKEEGFFDTNSGIHTYAFSGTSGQKLAITTHTFDDGYGYIGFNGDIKTIGNYAFYRCNGMTEFNLPKSVRTIGDKSFSACTSLTSVSLPNGVITIGNRTFEDCRSVTSVIIPNTVKTIGGSAFANCTGLTSITIPDSVTSIGDWVFYNCRHLKNVILGNGITAISESTFEGCSGLTSVNIPSGVTSIGQRSFFNCTGLTSITIPNSVTTIGGSAFYDCGLTSVIIPYNVTEIGGSAFYYCNLASAIIYATTPPSLGDWRVFSGSNYPIYVPAESVDAYKNASGNWSEFKYRIQAIPT